MRRIQRRCASQQNPAPDARDESDSAAAQCPWHVRYPSESCPECGHLRLAGLSHKLPLAGSPSERPRQRAQAALTAASMEPSSVISVDPLPTGSFTLALSEDHNASG
jgi:hypothetical protein